MRICRLLVIVACLLMCATADKEDVRCRAEKETVGECSLNQRMFGLIWYDCPFNCCWWNKQECGYTVTSAAACCSRCQNLRDCYTWVYVPDEEASPGDPGTNCFVWRTEDMFDFRAAYLVPGKETYVGYAGLEIPPQAVNVSLSSTTTTRKMNLSVKFHSSGKWPRDPSK